MDILEIDENQLSRLKNDVIDNLVKKINEEIVVNRSPSRDDEITYKERLNYLRSSVNCLGGIPVC